MDKQPELVIRSLQTADPDSLFLDHIRLKQEVIANYQDRMLITSYPVDPAYVRKVLEGNHQCIALAILDGMTIGTITMVFPTEFKRRHKAALSSTYVYKNHTIRSKLKALNMPHGTSWYLKKHMLEEARRRGYETVISQSSTTHKVSHDVNISLGAKLVGTECRGMKLLDNTYVDVYTFEFDVSDSGKLCQ